MCAGVSSAAAAEGDDNTFQRGKHAVTCSRARVYVVLVCSRGFLPSHLVRFSSSGSSIRGSIPSRRLNRAIVALLSPQTRRQEADSNRRAGRFIRCSPRSPALLLSSSSCRVLSRPQEWSSSSSHDMKVWMRVRSQNKEDERKTSSFKTAVRCFVFLSGAEAHRQATAGAAGAAVTPPVPLGKKKLWKSWRR